MDKRKEYTLVNILSFGHHPEHKISNNQKYDHDIHNSQIEWKSPASYKCLGASQNLNID